MIDNIGEKTIYGVYLNNSLVLTIRRYDETADLNQGEDDIFIMSIAYLGGDKDGIVFLLTKGGYIVGKIYSLIKNNYVLQEQTDKLDTIDPFFAKFEDDLNNSSVLQTLDNYNHLFIKENLEWIKTETLSEDEKNELSKIRDALSYQEKLKQQKITRRDPIEFVLIILHEWERFIMRKIDERHKLFLKELDLKKFEQNKKKRFSVIDGPINYEDVLLNACSKFDDIRKQLKGNLSREDLLKLKDRFDKIQDLLNDESDIVFSIDEEICKALEKSFVKKDFGFKELGNNQGNTWR